MKLGGLPYKPPAGVSQGKPEESGLEGKTLFRGKGVELVEQQAIVRESEYRCHHCEGALPSLDFTVKIPQRGPVLLTAEKGSTKGIFDRSQAWYCLCCAANHPFGAEVRKEVLRQGWGRLLAWKPGGIRGPEVKPVAYLSALQHRAAAGGAENALPWLSAAGLEYGDLWTLSRAMRVSLARMTRGEFPMERPRKLREREQWSGPLLIQALAQEDGGWWMDLCQATFVVLESGCWAPAHATRRPEMDESPEGTSEDVTDGSAEEASGIDLVDAAIAGEEPVVPSEEIAGDQPAEAPFVFGGFSRPSGEGVAESSDDELPPGMEDSLPPDF